MYTLTPQADVVPERLIPEEVLSWNKKNLRNFLYPRECDIFMNKLHEHKANDEDLIAALPAPPAATEAMLHSDAAPAFVGLTKYAVYLTYT